ncbi:hypothetical protein COT03_00900 [Candidatus Shapirobacteria bacterium CG07_land_8_20_14_0_80_39_18]|uniref:Uncharacterized protein n=1 Tax=Candidatus Shapirobacteria bacterium CG07_land_8_20_14_0_80_39_18 TaxID=1974882 RepID=A0A2M6YRQ3_9BACT|nr:MAG: hypothetical protein COT03_00900 [Candidatus Shapirobacteria bacterium CG07_land_8_20_14_0_80_39_18]
MNLIMNDNMNSGADTKRVTVSLPSYIYDRLIKRVPERQVSRFVAGLLEEKLIVQKKQITDPIKDFVDLRSKLPKVSDKKIFAAIRKGRM